MDADTPAEDILCILYNAFEFIDQAIANGGRVLVHCSQSTALLDPPLHLQSSSSITVLARTIDPLHSALHMAHAVLFETAFQQSKAHLKALNGISLIYPVILCSGAWPPLGVSRSATIVIAYMMWKMRKSYDEAYAHVKAARDPTIVQNGYVSVLHTPVSSPDTSMANPDVWVMLCHFHMQAWLGQSGH
eukprot:scaffold66887_cov24-Tisochrysis_lutea.AAC.1